MSKKYIVLIVFILLAIGYVGYLKYYEIPVDTTYKPSFFYLGGIQINEANQEDWVAMLKKASMNTVEVSVYAYQGEWDSDSIRLDTTDAKALEEIRAAKKGGMKVALILRMNLDFTFERNRFIWHGMIMPKTELLSSWFDNYQRFVIKWADIAEEEGIDILGIASEMNALSETRSSFFIPKLYSYYNNLPRYTAIEERAYQYKEVLKSEDLWLWGYKPYKELVPYIEDRIKCHHAWSQQVSFAQKSGNIDLINQRNEVCHQHWKKIIAATRKHFSGKITYAANFDNYMNVAFWEDLDFIGINAYFGLRNPNATFNNPKELKSALKSGWEVALGEVNSFRLFQNLLDKPLLFTELGYVNRESSTIEPWAGFGFSIIGSWYNERLVVWGKEKINYEERKLAMDALYEVVKERHINLEGILYWKLTTHDYHMPYEPFALHLTEDAADSLQSSLSKFISLTNR